MPNLKIGEDARKALARNRVALASANANLKCSRQWYESVAASYSGD